jgi:SRSO17 transposase
MGILTSQNLDTREGLENLLSVRIDRIPAELPHSTEPELEKLRWTQTDSNRASMLELLCGLPTS